MLYKDVVHESKFILLLLTAVKLVAAVRAVFIAVAVERAGYAAVILTLELVGTACNVAPTDLRRLVPSIGAVAVAVTYPSFVHTRHPVLAFELRRYAW